MIILLKSEQMKIEVLRHNIARSLYFYQYPKIDKMARTPTIQIELGFIAPDFTLPDVLTGKSYSLSELQGTEGTAVFFICNHCPFVIDIIDELVKIGNDYLKKGIGFIVISSNDITNYPDDSPKNMKLFAAHYDFPFPYLYDETQEVAKAYTAACTPDINVFNAELKCIYRGQMDKSRPGNDYPSDGKDLRKVFNYLLENKDIDFEQLPSIGCGIKWKA